MFFILSHSFSVTLLCHQMGSGNHPVSYSVGSTHLYLIAQVENEWSCTIIPPYDYPIHRENFTFAFILVVCSYKAHCKNVAGR